VVFAPLMVAIAAIIKLSDPAGPVLFRQVRVGQHGKLFTMYKFRSMYVDAEAHGRGAVWANAADSRIIPWCRWMRRSHVDELPQLINILQGEMSLVGPRPERPEMYEKLSREVAGFGRRLEVKPGVTGPAQIHNGYDTDIESVRRKLEMDVAYIESLSIGNELRLIFGTFAKFRDDMAH
jgi:lipopolysaccharide/colanic/teichoic acid biosynthesis glycosyltransferase